MENNLLHTIWKIDLCHQGESCWCRMISSLGGEEGDVISSGELSKEISEHIVELHNKSLKELLNASIKK